MTPTQVNYVSEIKDTVWVGEDGKLYPNGGPVDLWHGMSMLVSETIYIEKGDTVILSYRTHEILKLIRKDVVILDKLYMPHEVGA